MTTTAGIIICTKGCKCENPVDTRLEEAKKPQYQEWRRVSREEYWSWRRQDSFISSYRSASKKEVTAFSASA